MRISDAAKQFGIQIETAQAAAPGEVVYRVKDIFTTRDGSWEPSNKPGSVPQWARDTYLKSPSHPQYNDDGGADHHIFGAVWRDGALIASFPIEYYTDGKQNHTTQIAKRHGWANIVMYSSSSYVPERGERGPWRWQPAGVKADVVVGAGMPSNWHVSWFAVWEAVRNDDVVIPTEPTEPGGPVDTSLEKRVAALEADNAKLKALLRQWTGDGR